jgi:hypothetical protein
MQSNQYNLYKFIATNKELKKAFVDSIRNKIDQIFEDPSIGSQLVGFVANVQQVAKSAKLVKSKAPKVATIKKKKRSRDLAGSEKKRQLILSALQKNRMTSKEIVQFLHGHGITAKNSSDIHKTLWNMSKREEIKSKDIVEGGKKIKQYFV